MDVAVRQPVVVHVLVGVMHNGRELRHLGLRVHVGMRQAVVMVPLVDMRMIRTRATVRLFTLMLMHMTMKIAMRRIGCMAMEVALFVASYWHVHFQSCMFQVIGYPWPCGSIWRRPMSRHLSTK